MSVDSSRHLAKNLAIIASPRTTWKKSSSHEAASRNKKKFFSSQSYYPLSTNRKNVFLNWVAFELWSSEIFFAATTKKLFLWGSKWTTIVFESLKIGSIRPLYIFSIVKLQANGSWMFRPEPMKLFSVYIYSTMYCTLGWSDFKVAYFWGARPLENVEVKWRYSICKFENFAERSKVADFL